MFNSAGQVMQGIGKARQVIKSMTGKEYSFEYDQRAWWEILLRRPKRMKKVVYEVELKFHD